MEKQSTTRNFLSNKQGFTYLETVIAVGVIVLLGVMGMSAFSNWNKKEALNSTWLSGIALLEEARSRTLSSDNSSSYGVHFESDKIVLFRNPYNPNDPDNKNLNLSGFLLIDNISLNGAGAEVIFKRLSGETDNYGSVMVSEKNDPSKFKIIEIQETGTVK